MKLAATFRQWIRGSLGSREELTEHSRFNELLDLLDELALCAEFYAVAATPHRDALPKTEAWMGFRERAEKLSRPYPALRPALGKVYLGLQHLETTGLGGALPEGTYDHILFSTANPRYASYCELRGLLNEIRSTIRAMSTTG